MRSIKDISPEEKKYHFRNLVVMSLADGKITDDEKSVLGYAASKWGISKEVQDEVMQHLEEIESKVPDDPEVRFQQLYDLVEIMIIDGELKIVEKDLCSKIAQALGYQPAAVDVVKNGILAGNRKYSSQEEMHKVIKARLEPLIPN